LSRGGSSSATISPSGGLKLGLSPRPNPGFERAVEHQWRTSHKSYIISHRDASDSYKMSFMRVDDWSTYRETRNWPQLDGLRAVSILLVLAFHMHDPIWTRLYGGRGVTLFFVISGFLITSLLLREQERTGKLSLRGFYIRRTFRIMPLYFLALSLATILVLAFDLGQGGNDFLHRLPLLATFNGEFAGSGTFSHSWSLGIEEKFYLVWPVLLTTPMISRRLGTITAILILMAAFAAFSPTFGYFGIYTPIISGCAIAIAMHYKRSYAHISFIARPASAYAALMIFLLVLIFPNPFGIEEQSKYAHVLFGLAAALAFPGVLIGHTIHRRLMELSPIVEFGKLAYPIYLFHPFILEVVDRVVAPGSSNPLHSIPRLIAVVLITTTAAVVINKCFADPLNEFGHRISRRTLRNVATS